MRDLVITGFMGTGKTTVGRLLAKRYGLQFVDTDEEIERRTGRSITDIITQDGERVFRRMEREMLRKVAAGSSRVIATGGGALLSEENRSLFDADQPVVCLTCDPTQLLWRLSSGGDRPLLDPPSLQRIADLLEARAEAYATFPQIDTTGKPPDLVASEIASRYPLEMAAQMSFARSSTSNLVVGEDVLHRIGEVVARGLVSGPVLVLTDETVASLGHADSAEASLRREGFEVALAVLSPGEEAKTLRSLETLYHACLDAGLSRSGIVVGVGGGVICDLAGMLAATYMRGVRLVLAPTTLLAQVDAAIGGKTAVDVAGVKNLVGAFYPADIILVDPAVLRTLDRRLLAEGMAEVVKIAFIQSADLLADLQTLTAPDDVLDRADIVRRAALLKADLVERDPYEAGDRILLNFGHTVGHGLEAASSYHLAHGQAIAIGMAAELRIAIDLNAAPAELEVRLRELLERMELIPPGSLDGIDPREAVRAMRGDKKRLAGVTRFAVPIRPGEGSVIDVSQVDVERAVDLALEGALWRSLAHRGGDAR